VKILNLKAFFFPPHVACGCDCVVPPPLEVTHASATGSFVRSFARFREFHMKATDNQTPREIRQDTFD
jgi:hypothetical protein